MATWDAKGQPAPDPELQEAPYQGRAGATRLEAVHVAIPGGTLRTVGVYRAVNVATDPQLRDAALGGNLHRLDGGVDLAIPFVFHDPPARKIALVLPEPLRHDELRERARFLEQLAGDTSVPVPPYARDATTVVGIAELREYLAKVTGAKAARAQRELEAELASHGREIARHTNALAEREEALGEREHQLGERERQLMAREQALSAHEPTLAERDRALALREQAVREREQTLTQREQRMRERAEDVTRREDELAGLHEEHEASQRDLAMREQELEQRLESLVQRERDLAARERAREEREPDGDGRPTNPRPITAGAAAAPRTRSSRPPPPPAASSVSAAIASALSAARPPVATPVDGDDVEELDELDPIRTNPGAAASTGTATTVPPDEVEELVDDEDVEEEVDDADVEEDRGPKTQIATASGIAAAEEALAGSSTDPGLAKPPELRGDVQMVARAGDGVDLFVSLGNDASAFSGEVDLLVQLLVVEGCPVALLTLVDAGPDGVARRVALDPRNAADKRVLDSLRRAFEARTVFYDAGGSFVRASRVTAARELNVARVLDRIARVRGEPGVDFAAASQRVLASPPPVRGGHPFSADDDGRPDTPSRARAALIEIAEWASPEKMEHALLVLSVSRDAIDAAFARVLERGVAHGLAIPASLHDRALGAGLAPDASALVTKQIDAFSKTVALADRGGLDDEAIASNWEKLLASAADNEVAVDSDTHEIAWRAIRAVRGEQTGSMPGGTVDAARLAAMGPPELVMLLEHPRHRRAAALALCDRGDAALAEPLCKAVRKMPRAEVVRVVPRITKLGDEAGDALIDGLGARKTFARQAFALALGHLKLRRAVVPLLHLLGSEPTDVWREVARVYGTFGNASFRTLSQKLADPKAPDDRFVLALAHLANHGCTKQVEALEKDKDSRVAAVALRALQMRDEARRQEEVAQGRRPADGADAVLAFSRRFAQELEGNAPEADLPGDEA
jgi:hypothetical protein